MGEKDALGERAAILLHHDGKRELSLDVGDHFVYGAVRFVAVKARIGQWVKYLQRVGYGQA